MAAKTKSGVSAEILEFSSRISKRVKCFMCARVPADLLKECDEAYRQGAPATHIARWLQSKGIEVPEHSCRHHYYHSKHHERPG